MKQTKYKQNKEFPKIPENNQKCFKTIKKIPKTIQKSPRPARRHCARRRPVPRGYFRIVLSNFLIVLVFLIVFRDFWEFLILLVCCLFHCVFGLRPFVGQALLGPSNYPGLFPTLQVGVVRFLIKSGPSFLPSSRPPSHFNSTLQINISK